MGKCISEIKRKGYFYQCTNQEALTNKLDTEKMVVYAGFDCTAKSLHVGNLVQIMLLGLLQRYGHKIIVIIGDATTRIGDPTGKTEMRKMLSEQTLEENIKGIKHSLEKFIKFSNDPNDAIMISNSSWLSGIGYIDFLTTYGRHVSVNRMVSMDSVKSRLQNDQSLSFLEFNYMLIQAYDFYHLHKTYSCSLQIGGSDQWGNIVTGVELIKKMLSNEVYGLTTPLVTNANGVKMGKSVEGAVWLNQDMLTPYEYFQYWRNVDDKDVARFARLYCNMSNPEIDEFDNLCTNNINEAKKRLAYLATQACHGSQEAELALKTSIELFELNTLSGIRAYEFAQKDIEDGLAIVNILCFIGATRSRSDAKQLIRGGGVRINDIVIEDEQRCIEMTDLLSDKSAKLSCGKKKHFLIRMV